MNGRTGTAMAGPAPGLAGGMQAAATARPAPAGGRQRLGMRPWPLFSALGPLGALPSAPGVAREFTMVVLGGWDMARVPDLADVSLLIVSEFSTNVVQAGTGGDGRPVYQADGRLSELWLRLMSDRARLRIEIWDNLPRSAGVPVLRHPAGEEEHGRGLALVSRLSRDWGWDPVPGLQAKAVWALLEVR
jgi:hypothetical protein